MDHVAVKLKLSGEAGVRALLAIDEQEPLESLAQTRMGAKAAAARGDLGPSPASFPHRGRDAPTNHGSNDRSRS